MANLITIPREAYNFLMGEGPLEGVWFGDLHEGLPGEFWWRGLLKAAAGWPEPDYRDPKLTGAAGSQTTGVTSVGTVGAAQGMPPEGPRREGGSDALASASPVAESHAPEANAHNNTRVSDKER